MKDDRRDSSCAGKRLYGDLPTARKMARRTNNDRDAHCAAYHCCKCHGWHVGNTDRIPKKPKPNPMEELCPE